MSYTMGEMICRSRQNKKMTQEELASRLGIMPQTVSRWEREKGFPDISLIEGICNILDISANTLFGMESGKIVENNSFSMEREIGREMFAEPLVLEFGRGLVACVAEGLKTNAMNKQRKQLVSKTGILLPVVRIKDNGKLTANQVRILSYDEILWEEELEKIEENTYKKIVAKLGEACQNNYEKIINKQLVKILIDNLKERYSGVVEGLVPEKISYLQVEEKLKEVLREKGNIRDLIHILEDMEREL